MKHFLVTGGVGYIGSHCVLELLQTGCSVVVLDNLCNSSVEALRRIERLTGHSPTFVEGDVRDVTLLTRLFAEHSFAGVFHFAGLKAVGESAAKPLLYFDNNISGTVALCDAMARAGVFSLVFSSSATVYGASDIMPLSESAVLGSPSNPYGRSKSIVEGILRDLADSDPRWRIAVLRYFNPVGAHPSGLIGEDPLGIPNNLLPYISQVAVGRLKELTIYGDDYPTPDGTGVRDYIHVMDLAVGHLKALTALETRCGYNIWNLGAGQGYSVYEILKAFKQVSGRSVPFRVSARRSGDVAQCWADPSKAMRELGWRAQRGLLQMMEDTWRWQQKNPEGYRNFKQTGAGI